MPKGADNITAVLDAARDLFPRLGFAATTMDAIAREAAVSKATVYSLFGTKDALFAAMVGQLGAEQVLGADLPLSASASASEVLLALASDAAALLLAPSNIALQRVVASESARTPDIGRLFYRSGPEIFISHLADCLARLSSAGALAVPNPRLAATQFLAIIVGDLQLRSMMGLADTITSAERIETIRSGVATFLLAYAAVPLS